MADNRKRRRMLSATPRMLPETLALRNERMAIYAEMRDAIEKHSRMLMRELETLSDAFALTRTFSLGTPMPAEADDLGEALAPARAVIDALQARLTYLCESLRAHHEDNPVQPNQ